jgi:hypothetical protein
VSAERTPGIPEASAARSWVARRNAGGEPRHGARGRVRGLRRQRGSRQGIPPTRLPSAFRPRSRRSAVMTRSSRRRTRSTAARGRLEDPPPASFGRDRPGRPDEAAHLSHSGVREARRLCLPIRVRPSSPPAVLIRRPAVASLHQLIATSRSPTQRGARRVVVPSPPPSDEGSSPQRRRHHGQYLSVVLLRGLLTNPSRIRAACSRNR